MKGIKSYIIAGIIFVSVLGTLLHFAYDLSGNNFIVGLFTPINESIWEHTKLIYFPMLFYLYISKKAKHPCTTTAMLFGALSGVLLIISLFYSYSGIIGYNIAIVDISIFYISVIMSFYIAYKLTLSCKVEKHKVILYVLNIIIILAYVLFTFNAPQIPLLVAP